MFSRDDIPLRVDLLTAEEAERCLVSEPLEVLSTLRALEQEGTLIGVYPDEGSHFFLTTLAEVDAARRRLIFDGSARRTLDQRVLEAEELVFIATHQRIKLSFRTGAAAAAEADGSPAFVVPFPDQLLRLQRREYYRIIMPVLDPLKCRVTCTHQGRPATVELKVLDISCGGIAAAAQASGPPLESGGPYPCIIEVPGEGPVALKVEVRYAFQVTLANGAVQLRFGLQFIDPGRAVVAAIQRYIMKAERELRARGLTY